MKIKTLNVTIRHQQNPAYDAERLAAIEAALNDFCPVEDVAESMIDTMRKINPDVKEIVVLDNCAMIEIGMSIHEVDITGFNFADLFTSLLAECLRGGA